MTSTQIKKNAQIAAAAGAAEAGFEAVVEIKAPKARSVQRVWAMGKVTPKGIVVLEFGDHNVIEHHSAKINKEAGTRVAFVVDMEHVPTAALKDAKEVHDEDEGEEE